MLEDDAGRRRRGELPYLARRYHRLRETLPWARLGAWPTPVEPLRAIGAQVGAAHLYVKRDDLSSPVYGGNKVRKLELLLAAARRDGRRAVVTMGAAGSNHVVATATHARRLGLETTAVLVPQPPRPYIADNLLADLGQGALLLPSAGPLEAARLVARTWAGRSARDQRPPWVIPPGGSSPLGTLGYVECAFELAEQVRGGRLPEPDVVFVPAGSCGTLAGLTLGLPLAGLRTRAVGVRVYDRVAANRWLTALLANAALALLRRCDGSVPARAVRPSDVVILDDAFGSGYARPTEEAREAIRIGLDLEGLQLDETYSGKAMASFLRFARSRPDATALFVTTWSSAPLGPLQAGASRARLPRELRRYMEPHELGPEPDPEPGSAIGERSSGGSS